VWVGREVEGLEHLSGVFNDIKILTNYHISFMLSYMMIYLQRKTMNKVRFHVQSAQSKSLILLQTYEIIAVINHI
jgi:hypothetical protein